MLDWIKNIFKKLQEEPINNSPYKGFSVEYYPLTGRYYPMYKGKYLWKTYSTGIYKLEFDKHWNSIQYSSSEEGAWEVIDRFREQSLKENVKVLTR